MECKFIAWDWDGAEYVQIPTDNVVEAIYWAWNYEFVVYEVDGQEKNMIFNGQLDNEENSEMLGKYRIRVIDHEKRRHLQNVETGEVYNASWH